MFTRKWEVKEFIGNSTEPKTIKRLWDTQVFSIGDFVTNGTKMRGYIEKFDYSFQGDEVYVYTDWSGVGMNLASIEHKLKLPSLHQVGDQVTLSFGTSGLVNNCQVIKVHFTNSKVLYDVEVIGNFDSEVHYGIVDRKEVKENNIWSTRLYNIDSVFVMKRSN